MVNQAIKVSHIDYLTQHYILNSKLNFRIGKLNL